MLVPLFALIYLLAIYILLTLVTKREKLTAHSSSDLV
jgi:hypothetical protein